jgi:hypothetical protein
MTLSTYARRASTNNASSSSSNNRPHGEPNHQQSQQYEALLAAQQAAQQHFFMPPAMPSFQLSPHPQCAQSSPKQTPSRRPNQSSQKRPRMEVPAPGPGELQRGGDLHRSTLDQGELHGAPAELCQRGLQELK